MGCFKGGSVVFDSYSVPMNFPTKILYPFYRPPKAEIKTLQRLPVFAPLPNWGFNPRSHIEAVTKGDIGFHNYRESVFARNLAKTGPCAINLGIAAHLFKDPEAVQPFINAVQHSWEGLRHLDFWRLYQGLIETSPDLEVWSFAYTAKTVVSAVARLDILGHVRSQRYLFDKKMPWIG